MTVLWPQRWGRTAEPVNGPAHARQVQEEFSQRLSCSRRGLEASQHGRMRPGTFLLLDESPKCGSQAERSPRLPSPSSVASAGTSASSSPRARGVFASPGPCPHALPSSLSLGTTTVQAALRAGFRRAAQRTRRGRVERGSVSAPLLSGPCPRGGPLGSSPHLVMRRRRVPPATTPCG